MKTTLRLALLALLLAALAPAPVLAAAHKPPPGKPAPQSTTPPAKMDDKSAVAMLLVLGALVVVGGGGFVIWRLASGGKKGTGDGRPPEPIVAQRKYDWELTMTEEQEAAMLRGIQAYRDGGHSLYLSHDDALIFFYEPTMLVSLHRLAPAFVATGPAGIADPVAAMKTILDGCAAAEGPGVLHTRKGWYTPIDNLDHNQFTSLCHDALTCPQPYIEGIQGSGSDENNGWATVNVEVGGPKNTLLIDIGRVLAQVQPARASRPTDPLIDLLRPILQGMCKGQTPGATWTRGAATPAELDLISRVVATSASRPR